MTDHHSGDDAARLRPPTRASFAFVFVTVMLDMLALGIVVPVLPKLIATFENGDYGSAAHMIGLFGFAWAAMQFIFSPVMGSLADSFGRRPVIIMSNLGLGADYVVMALAPSVGWLFVGRLISGITTATFSTASAYIADVTPPEQRAGKFGMLGAAFGLGFVIGPAIGGLLGEIDLRLPFWVAGGFSLANGIYGFFVLPESLPKELRTRFHWRMANPLGSLKLLRSHAMVLALATASFFQRVAHDVLPSVTVIYTDYRYGWSTATVGAMLAGVGISSMLVSGFLTAWAVKHFKERKVMIFGLLAGIVGFSIYGAAALGQIFIMGLPFVALWGMSNPTMMAFMSARVGPSEQGQLQGALSSLGGIAGMIGPILMTQAFALGLHDVDRFHVPGLPFFLAAALILAALILAVRATKER
jgi:DHA1 family tetracycline resistance protein-like MFS transporter